MKNLYFLLVFCFGLFANAQIVNIPDANFKAKLLSSSATNTIAFNLNNQPFKIDANNNNEIEVAEAAQVKRLAVQCVGCAANLKITSIVGIEAFTNMNRLDCANNAIESLDLLSTLTGIEYLSCHHNQLASINFVNSLPNLKEITAGYNLITNLNIANLVYLLDLECSNNQISNITIENCNLINAVSCNNNLLTSVSFSENLTNLDYFTCGNNPITSINLTNLINLTYLNVKQTQITELNTNNLQILTSLYCELNPLLENVFIKNGNIIATNQINFSSCPALKFICSDEGEITMIQNKISQYGYTNCFVNTYCTFTPGGTYYVIQGTTKLDQTNNGCESTDSGFRDLKFNLNNITNNTNTIIFPNQQGNFSIPVQQGNYTLTPILDSPSDFTINPTSTNFSFPAQSSPQIQNFCVNAVVPIHEDLCIFLFPTYSAAPGFDATYKIYYRNKGNTIRNGQIVLNFAESKMDLVQSSPFPNNGGVDQYTWNFTNLLPNEYRIINFTFNINTPTQSLPVSVGDNLLFQAHIYPDVYDEVLQDNHSVLVQTVVGSYDPNNKTCLEGTTITPDKVGDYVHYIIRFENTGTASAQNVVVKDIIDTTKYDISTLIPIDGSHDFYTRINNTNQVEFIFENIQLPFDDANNDGYVAFKIKTKPNLTVGSSFSNTANIYFDYNFPIVTNTATTTIQALGTSDFEFNDYFTLSPVPTKDVLHFATNQSIAVSSISIYNSLGQLVQVNTKPGNTVDVSNLKSGTYFIKVISDKGSSVGKFVKQ